jgi:nicotinate-nucleotide adenylyltransferase
VVLDDLRSVGILGGTFNPPHIGHVALARHARTELGLERVLLMPAFLAPNKRSMGEDPGPEHRLQMCRLAVAQEPGVEASALEIERGGTSYTVDTVQSIHDAHPDAVLTLIVGADTARTLSGWREPARLLGMVRLAVAQRDEPNSGDVREALAWALALGAPRGLGSPPRLTLLRMARVAASSSAVRQLIAAGAPVGELVGETVARYIAEHGLYRAAGPPVAATAGGGVA